MQIEWQNMIQLLTKKVEKQSDKCVLIKKPKKEGSKWVDQS